MRNMWLVLLAMSFPVVAFGIAPIALNSGGAPAWSGGSFASASTISADGCAAYSFLSESTLGFGRRAADQLCLGTNGANGGVDVRAVSSKTQLVLGAAYSAATPHLAEMDNTTTGLSISDGSSGFTWSASGTAKWTMNTSGGRNYLCVGPWNTDKVPCFTTTDGGTDFVMMESDGSSWTGTLLVAAGNVRMKDGTAAAPSIVFDNDNTGVYRVGTNELGMSVNGTRIGSIAKEVSAGTVYDSAKPDAGYYLNIGDHNGAPTAGDCDANAETGRFIYDYTNHKLMVCNEQSTTRAGWDYVGLTD